MLTRLVVFAGLLLVWSLNPVAGLAAGVDKNNPDSPETNVVYEWDNYDEVIFDDLNRERLEINFDENISPDANIFDEDLRAGVDYVDGYLGYDRAELIADGANLFNGYDLPSANVEFNIN